MIFQQQLRGKVVIVGQWDTTTLMLLKKALKKEPEAGKDTHADTSELSVDVVDELDDCSDYIDLVVADLSDERCRASVVQHIEQCAGQNERPSTIGIIADADGHPDSLSAVQLNVALFDDFMRVSELSEPLICRSVAHCLERRRERIAYRRQRENIHQRLTQLSSSVGAVAHEMNTSLGVARTAVSLVNKRAKSCADSPTTKSVTSIATDEMADILDGGSLAERSIDRSSAALNSLARIAVGTQDTEQRRIDLTELISDCAGLMNRCLKTKGIHVTFESSTAERFEWVGYRGPLVQVMTGLIESMAIDPPTDGSSRNITVTVQQTNDPEGYRIDLRYAADHANGSLAFQSAKQIVDNILNGRISYSQRTNEASYSLIFPRVAEATQRELDAWLGSDTPSQRRYRNKTEERV